MRVRLWAVTVYTYDFNGNETQIIHKSPTGAVLAEYDYSYDEAGDLVSETDNGVTTNYQYDATGQLVGYGNVTQSYDPNGNRNGSGYVVGPDNQLLSDGTWNYTYDNEGNESSKTNIATGVKWTYGYDNINELVSVVETDANGNVEVEADYKYDVFGNRIEKDVWTPATGTMVTKFAYDAWNPNVPSGTGNENWNVWAELDANNDLLVRYMRGDNVDQIFAEEGPGGAVAWFLTDQLGSARVLVDNRGNVLDEIDYDAFGNITSQSNAAEQPLYLYAGREFDVETGLQYNRARYYDPSTGRWITQDPKGFNAGDSNLYRYVGNAPTEATDPSGLQQGGGFGERFGKAIKDRNKQIDDLSKGNQKDLKDFVQGKPFDPAIDKNKTILGEQAMKLLDSQLKVMQPFVQWKKFAVDGFLGSAWHTITHPWEIVTGTIEFLKDPVGGIKGTIEAFKKDPATVLGALTFQGLLTKGLGKLGAALGGGCFVEETPVVLDEQENCDTRLGFSESLLTGLGAAAFILAASTWLADNLRRRDTPAPYSRKLGIGRFDSKET